MDDKTLRRCSARARIAKAMAHPLRIHLLELLADKARCVQDLTERSGVEQSTVSKHLSILREAGLVAGSRSGTTVEYRVVCCCLDSFFDCLEAVLRQNLQVQRDALKA